jgi:hypothetical protein
MSNEVDPGAIIARIERDTGIPGLAGILNRLSPTDLQSLLLHVQRTRALEVTPDRLLRRYIEDRFVRPAKSNPVLIAKFEQAAYAALPDGYETLELSPLCPLGTCSAIATVDQNKIVSTVRNSEVVSDATNVLALESALRRKDRLKRNPKSIDLVKLVCSHRLVRAQYVDAPGMSAHFRLLALTASGRDTGSFEFELNMLREQMEYFVRIYPCGRKLTQSMHQDEDRRHRSHQRGIFRFGAAFDP